MQSPVKVIVAGFSLMLLLFALARAALIVIYPDYFEQSLASLAGSFWYGLRFDFSITAALLAIPSLLLMLPVPLARKNGWVKMVWALMMLIMISSAFLLIADIIYFEYVQRHIGRELVMLADDMGFVIDMVLNQYRVHFLIFLFVMGLLWKGSMWLFSKPLFQSNQRFSWIRGGAGFIASVLVLVVIARGGFGGKPIQSIDAYADGNEKKANLVLNGVFTAIHTSRKSKSIKYAFFNDEEKLRLGPLFGIDTTSKHPFQREYSDNKLTGKNIVILFLESWGQRYVDALAGNNFGVTPNMDKLVEDSLVFENFYAAGQRSAYGIQATLTGIPIIQGFPYLGAGLEVSRISRLGALAGRNGYSSVMMQTSLRHSLRLNSIALGTGFDIFYGQEDFPIVLDYPDPASAHFGWDYEMLHFFKNEADKINTPFLSFLFTGTTHEPYAEPPKELQKYPHGEDHDQDFLNEIFYSDWAIGEFFRNARKSTWFKDTVFIITADHARGGDADEMHGQFRIPLLIYSPGYIQPGRRTEVASQLNLMATAVDLMGISEPFSAMGESLLRTEDQFAMVFSGNLIGAVSDQGYVKHSLVQRIEQQGEDAEALDQLEQRLLLTNQLVGEALQSNTWAAEPD